MNQRSKIKACVLRGVQVFGFLYIQLSLSSRQPTATDFTSTVLCPLSAPSCHPLLTAHPSISETTHRPSAARVGTELCCYPDCLRLRSYSKCLKRREPSSFFFFFLNLLLRPTFLPSILKALPLSDRPVSLCPQPLSLPVALHLHHLRPIDLPEGCY